MNNKVLVIGIDSLDPKIISSLKNKLPNLNSLETCSQLSTTIPAETPVAWSSAATGSNPGRFGIFDFISRDPKTYLPKLNLVDEKKGIIKTEYQSAMKGIPFWRILSQNNIKTTIIRWPVTFPPEKINGSKLSGLGVVDIKNMLSSYALYTNEHIQHDPERKGRIINVNISNNNIDTYISGPLIQKRGEVKDIQLPIRIKTNEDNITMLIDNDEYKIRLREWSDMIRAKFKVFSFTEIYGIFKVYLENIKPKFRMYMSSIQHDPLNQFLQITSPKEYGRELVENIGEFYTLGMTEDVNAVKENALSEHAFIQQINDIENQREKIFNYEFSRFNEGLFAFIFDAGDRLKHIFWNNRILNGNNGFTISKEIEDYYVGKDRFIGDLLKKIDDRTRLMIFSDHGFNSFEKQVNINSWLVHEGFMKKSDSQENKLLKFVDWENTSAYSLGFTSIYINQKGREANGIISKDEKEKLIDEIISKLNQLRDDSGNVFTNIHKGSEIYKGKFSNLAPDIVVGFEQGYRMSDKNAIGILEEDIISTNNSKWKGDHLIDSSHVPGVLFANFKINKENPHLMDIAPTIYKIFNINMPDSVDGESLF